MYECFVLGADLKWWNGNENGTDADAEQEMKQSV
jgi:hypothetical protein